MLAAKSRFIPVIPRAEMLAELMRMKYSIAVAGAHGKTTTTSLVASILDAAGSIPRASSVEGSTARHQRSAWFKLNTSLRKQTRATARFSRFPHRSSCHEHRPGAPRLYRDIEEIKEAFIKFLNKVPFFGLVILCIDNPELQSLIPALKRRYMTYGLSKQADLRAEAVSHQGFTTSFTVSYKGTEMGDVVLATPGMHNVVNALAAIGVAIELDIPFATVQDALKRFAGIHRRLEVKWDKEVTLVDDYGHHPTEIKATLTAIRSMRKGKVIVAFQPHRYARTKACSTSSSHLSMS
jgi:UDP-N-acetylmuramate--alanine ligase